MVEKGKANPFENIRAIVKDQNGILSTSDLSRHGIPRTYLSILEKRGEFQRISRGVYSARGYLVDEMLAIQVRYQEALFWDILPARGSLGDEPSRQAIGRGGGYPVSHCW